MTQRNNRFRGRPARRRGRTGRNVWVNTNVNSTLAPDAVQILDLLTPAADFMTFDTTVVSVIVVNLHYSFASLGPDHNVHIACGLLTAIDTMDANDAPIPLEDNIGPPWMGLLMKSERVSGVASQNIPLTPNSEALRFQAKRRFRENNSTVWLVMQSSNAGIADSGITLDGIIRVLIHIP